MYIHIAEKKGEDAFLLRSAVCIIEQIYYGQSK